MLLDSLPDSYNSLINALESRPEKDLTISLVKGKLINEYRRRTSNSTVIREAQDKVLMTRESGKHEIRTKSHGVLFLQEKRPHEEGMQKI